MSGKTERGRLLPIAILALAGGLLSAGGTSAAQSPVYDQPAPSVHSKLTELSRAMAPKVYKAGDRVYVAVGHADANSIMVVGDGGVIIIDTTESLPAGRAVAAEFRKISQLPVKGIIYTHHHMDHLGGARAFADPEDVRSGAVTVVAQEDMMRLLASSETAKANPLFTRDVMTARFAYMFGAYLPTGPEGVVNAGTGPAMVAGPIGLLPPNKTFADSLDITIAGVRLHLFRTPGETEDAISIWMPDLKTVATGDLLMGETFPNLYTLRGAEIRNPVTWYRSIDRVRGFPAEHLVLSHGRPAHGEKQVAEVLTNQRDAIQYVHDQAVRLMNKGAVPDELAAAIPGLPPHLKDKPYLTEYYGSVTSSVRQLYNSYFGWFEGDPTRLDPLPPADRARRYVALMGGEARIVAEARNALAAKEYRWAADLLGNVIRINPANREARHIKADALRQIGYTQVNANARNWYLTSAKELDGDKLEIQSPWFRGIASPVARIAQFRAVPAATLLGILSTRLQAERTMDVNETMAIVVSDTGERSAIEIRRGVAEVHAQPPQKVDFTLTATKTAFARLVAGEAAPSALIAAKEASIAGDARKADRFLGYFDPPLRDWSALRFTEH